MCCRKKLPDTGEYAFDRIATKKVLFSRHETNMTIILQILWMSLLGLGVGLFSAGLGLGGGVLMVPAFITFIPEMDVHTAKGTSLFIILLVALTGFPRVRHAQEHRPQLTSSLVIIAGALAGGYLGAALTARMSEKAVLTLFLLFIVFLMLRLAVGEPQPFIQRKPTHKSGLLFCAGLAAGAAGSATGTGGGSLLAPLILLMGLLPHTQLVYSANQVMIATSIAAAPAHFMGRQLYHEHFTIGHVCLEVVPLIVLFAQVGIIIGVRLNHSMRAYHRRLILAWVLALVALRILIQMFV